MKAIIVRKHGQTTTRPTRYSASDLDGNTVMIREPMKDIDGHDAAALALLKKMGWSGKLVSGGTRGGEVYVFLPDCIVDVLPDLPEYQATIIGRSTTTEWD